MTKEEFFKLNPSCTANEMASACSIHYNTALRYLRKMGVENSSKVDTSSKEFKKLPDPFSHYSVSPCGTVIHNIKETNVKPRKNERGYLVVELWENTTSRKTVRVHRLVAEAFIPNPNNLPEVNHKDGNTSNPNVSNLEWITHQNNMIHAVENNLLPFQKITCQTAHSICKILEDKKAGKNTLTNAQIATQFDVSKSLIEKISQKKNWVHISKDYKF